MAGHKRKDKGLGEAVKKIRTEAGLSRAEFGRRYFIPVRTLENWEWGRNEPPLYFVRLLLRVIKEDFPQVLLSDLNEHKPEE